MMNTTGDSVQDLNQVNALKSVDLDLRGTIPERIREIFNRTYLEPSQKNLKEIVATTQSIIDEIESIHSLITSRNPDYKMMKEVNLKKQNIYHRIKELFTQPLGAEFNGAYPDLFIELDKYVDELPEIFREEQASLRFRCLESDKWQIKNKKRVKNFLYKTSISPKLVLNWLFRKIRKKPIIIRYWDHKIPVRMAVRRVYLAGLIKRIFQKEGEKYSSFLENIIKIKKLDNDIDLVLINRDKRFRFETIKDPVYADQLDEINNKVVGAINKNKKISLEVLSESDNEFFLTMDKANTVEMPSRYFRSKNIERKLKRYKNLWNVNAVDWSRTIYALFDDWRLDLEINRLKYLSYEGLFQAKRQLKQELNEYNSGFSRLIEVLGKIEQMVNTREALSRKKLHELKNYIRNELDGKIIPETLSGFELKKLTGIVLKIRKRLETENNFISENRALVKSDLYQRPIKEKEINFIKPNELISFEVFPHFVERTEQLKKSIENFHEEIARSLPDLDNIVLFSIDSAINNTPPDQDKINPENVEIILNGIARAQNRIVDFEKLTTLFFDNYFQMLFDALSKFTSDTAALMQNENAIDIRLKLLKAKTIHRTRSYELKIRRQFFRIFARGTHFYRDKSGFVFKKVENYRKKIYLSSADSVITHEISDFLKNSTDSINGLPVIYRSLYRVEPVIDMDLFVGRKKELSSIMNAYQKWQNNRPISVVFVGDKWGGLSSMVNYFIVNQDLAHQVIRISPLQKYYEPDKMCKLISVSFSLSESEDPVKIIKEIKSSSERRIGIIEDLQHFFLRSINGFKSLRMLMNVIRQTNQEVFWICTCTRYAWDYLVKTIQVDDFFQDVVKIIDMSSEEINTVIERRNLIGGFRIVYIPPKEIIENKKFKQLDSEAQQDFLEVRFLKRLNDFAQSNIGMALIFWLLSTREVTDDKILVGDFDRPDHSFLFALSQQRIQILLSLILHDGLNVLELSRVNNQSAEEVQFHLRRLDEEGIVENTFGQYKVNPLIYRQVISLLKLKNQIH